MNPGPEHETRLIAITAGTAAARETASTEADQLVDQVDWPALARRLEQRRLLPLLGERLIALAGARVPDSFVDATDSAIAACAERDSWLELISIQLTDALRDADIPALALKGPKLGRALYGDLGRRPSADIDLLVAPEDLHRAARTVQHFGYLPPPDPTDAGALPLLHLRLEHAGDALPPLELHWRVHWYETGFSRELLLRSIDAAAGTRPPRAHELASLLLYYARDGFLDLRLACDVARWWDVFGSELDPGAIAAIIDEHPRLERALMAAAQVAGRVVGLPTTTLIGSERRIERRVRLAERLANPDGEGSRQQLVADIWLVDWLLTPSGGRRDCVWRQLHTPGDVGSSLASPSRRRPLAALARAGRLIPRYGLSLMRIAHDRTGTATP